MLVILSAALVIIEVPKTGTQALRGQLARLADTAHDGAARHIGIRAYLRHHAPALTARLGRPPETVAVVRETEDRLASWHRYLQRDKVAGGPRSTRGVSFDAFVQASMLPDPPAYARVGHTDRQVGWSGGRAAVDHLFDYRRLDLLQAFLAARIPHLRPMPQRNVSPAVPPESLLPETRDRLRAHYAGEIALYAAVAATGYLGPG
jgi:hypothetical protein